ncbi:MAG: ATP-dependent helicase [Thermoleophilia bacterium]|nr:ATP-dependent helicase [Thermoleophilia bacterium]
MNLANSCILVLATTWTIMNSKDSLRDSSQNQLAADTLLAELNEQQRAAVLHGDGPLLVVAGAGTGKTATLAHRVAYLIAKGVDPGRILLLTFTRRAAAEMLRRVDALLERLETQRSAAARRSASAKVWGGTFHAVAARLLRLHGRLIGLDPAFTILDRSDAEDLMGLLRTELELARTDRRFPLKGTCMEICSRCVNARETVEEAVNNYFPWCRQDIEDLRRLFAAYVDRKGEQGVLDYDDLLLFWHGLLSHPRGAQAIRSRFDYVLVDEYQDTNRLQAEILKMLCPNGQGLTVVGDDAQAIYSFRAATVRNILDFPREFPGTTIVTLERNYRSTQPILEATNRVIAEAEEKHAKQLWTTRTEGARPKLVPCEDEDEQTEFVIQTVLGHREEGIPLRKQAVLFRASHHSLTLELELTRRNIPFRKYGGLRFVETAHVKDLLAFLRLVENPRDVVSGTRALMLLPGIGPKKAKTLMDQLLTAVSAGGNPFKTWEDLRPPSPASADTWKTLVELLDTLYSHSALDLPSQIRAIRTFYAPLMERLYDNVRARLLDLEQLEWIASRFPDRARLLAELALDPPTYSEDLAGPPVLDEDYLILSTMHSAKGLEWDVVYVIHASDGNIPSDLSTGRSEEIEEERRLFYVSLTRARDWLYVCYPLRYYSHPRSTSDIYGYALPSRFLSRTVREAFDIQAAAELLGGGAVGSQKGKGQPVDDTSQASTLDEIRQQIKRSL